MTNTNKRPLPERQRPGFAHESQTRQMLAECGKAAAISCYAHGILSLEATARLFAQHPEWRAA